MRRCTIGALKFPLVSACNQFEAIVQGAMASILLDMKRISKSIKLLLFVFLMISFQQLHAQIKSGLRFGLNYPEVTRLNPQESNGFHIGTYLKISLAGIFVLEPG